MKLLTGDKRHDFAKKTKSGVVSEKAALKLVKRYDPIGAGHGLRTTFRTWTEEKNKYEEKAMEFALACQKKKLDAAYYRADLLEARRGMMQDWADFVTSTLNPASIFQRLD